MSAKSLVQLAVALLCIQSILCINIITKAQWGGKPPKSRALSATKLSYVVVHHSAGAYCSTSDTCKQQMRNMQDYHMNSLGWSDIGYNFGIGGDGGIYEGRGYQVQGAHCSGWNANALGIMLIGNYNNQKPTAGQIKAAKALLADAVARGYLAPNYTIYGHRQVGSTECPGNHLYSEIQRWPGWKAKV